MSALPGMDCPSLLLVDDDADFCRVLGKALLRRGFEVRVAHSAAAGLKLAEVDPPECALVDLSMPGESGLMLIPRLKQIDMETRVVVLTGYASVATAVEAIKLGAMHYLAKPTDADEIVSAFQRLEGDPNFPVERRLQSVDRLEWEHIQKVLLEHNGNISETARQLHMHRRTLQRKLSKRPPSR